MLQLCDKGAILFADRYLPTHANILDSEDDGPQQQQHHVSAGTTNRHMLGPLIQGIILDGMADRDPTMACRALLLIKYVLFLHSFVLLSLL